MLSNLDIGTFQFKKYLQSFSQPKQLAVQFTYYTALQLIKKENEKKQKHFK